MDGDSVVLVSSMLVNVGLWASIFYKMGKVETENRHVADFLKWNCPQCQDNENQKKKREEVRL